jgi:3'-phosphoadenosine 5'-phosphosulfate (PAPS) 3'-phosphatase
VGVCVMPQMNRIRHCGSILTRFSSVSIARTVISRSFARNPSRPTANMAAFEGNLRPLLEVSKDACDVLAPMILAFYNAINGETAKLKSDASVFTIADGIVQHLLRDHLFAGDKFLGIVGEEDESNINIAAAPYKVDDLDVPTEFYGLIESTRAAIAELANRVHPTAYQSLTVFIDPIDGTREFSTGLGEQCSVCIGFSDSDGKPVAGLVYRPITSPPTWAAGAASEGVVLGHLDRATAPNSRGILTSNGAISPFIVALLKELDFVRVPSGGAGNKMLMLLEGKGGAYIQDRGVSRWDTCGAQAVIEAYGGTLSKLSPFIENKTLASYKYLKSPINLDFEPGLASLTPYNVAVKGSIKKGDAPKRATEAESVAPYSNLCGLFALDATCLSMIDFLFDGIQRAKAVSEPAYD